MLLLCNDNFKWYANANGANNVALWLQTSDYLKPNSHSSFTTVVITIMHLKDSDWPVAYILSLDNEAYPIRSLADMESSHLEFGARSLELWFEGD